MNTQKKIASIPFLIVTLIGVAFMMGMLILCVTEALPYWQTCEINTPPKELLKTSLLSLGANMPSAYIASSFGILKTFKKGYLSMLFKSS